MSVPCKHWIDIGRPRGGGCAIGVHERPSYGVCLKSCTEYEGPDRGLGDWVARTLKQVTGGRLKSCAGCKRRKVAVNRLVSYG